MEVAPTADDEVADEFEHLSELQRAPLVRVCFAPGGAADRAARRIGGAREMVMEARSVPTRRGRTSSRPTSVRRAVLWAVAAMVVLAAVIVFGGNLGRRRSDRANDAMAAVAESPVLRPPSPAPVSGAPGSRALGPSPPPPQHSAAPSKGPLSRLQQFVNALRSLVFYSPNTSTTTLAAAGVAAALSTSSSIAPDELPTISTATGTAAPVPSTTSTTRRTTTSRTTTSRTTTPQVTSTVTVVTTTIDFGEPPEAHVVPKPFLQAKSAWQTFQDAAFSLLFHETVTSTTSVATPSPTATEADALGGDPRYLPTLFCFLLVHLDLPEMDLVRTALAKETSVFACDEFSLFGERSQAVFPGLPLLGSDELQNVPGNIASVTALTHVKVAELAAKVSETALDIAIFVEAWRQLLEARRYALYEWIVKANPDTVFLPSRLRLALLPFSGGPSGPLQDGPPALYVLNCAADHSFRGALEVMSRAAVDIYVSGQATCKGALDRRIIGEALWTRSCLDLLSVPHVASEDVLDDERCGGRRTSCSSGAAAFHPLATPATLVQCFAEATALK